VIRDRDKKPTRDFDAIFASNAGWILKTPVPAPRINRRTPRPRVLAEEKARR